MKALIIAAVAALSMNAYAASPMVDTILQINSQIFPTQTVGSFVAGDTCNYSLNISSFVQGTMVMTVKSADSKTLVIDQDMDIMSQKQSCEETLDLTTGKVTNMVCNGQQQNASGDDLVIDSIKDEKVTVPAGTFDSQHVKGHQKSDNSAVEMWANPSKVPVGGMLKMLAQTQLGQMDVELTSFKKN